MRSTVVAVAFAALVPALALASNVVVTSSRSKTPATADWPASGTTSAGLSGSWDATEALTVDPSFAWSKPTAQTANGTVTTFPSTLLFGLGTSYLWGDFLFSLGGTFSPASTEETAASVPASEGANSPRLTYTLAQTTQPRYANFSAAWAPSWEGNVVPGLSVGADYDYYGVMLKATKVTLPDGKSTNDPREVNDFCQTALAAAKQPAKKLAVRDSCEATKKSLASTDAAALHILMPNVSGTLTLWENTDIGLGVTGYLYSDDPSRIGEWSGYTGAVPKLGTRTQTTKDTKVTAGAPKAGTRLEHTETGAITSASSYTANASVVHRLGAWKFSLALTRGQNRDDDGHYLTAGVKTYWKINKSWRVGVSVSATDDTDAEGAVSRSYLGGANLRYTF
jgi:hypothetical protein